MMRKIHPQFLTTPKALLLAVIAAGSLTLSLRLAADNDTNQTVTRIDDPALEAEKSRLPIADFLERLDDAAELFPGADDDEHARFSELLRAFYEERGHRPAWLRAGEVRTTAEKLLRRLRAADEHGLRPADYRAEELTAEVERIDDERHPMPVDLVRLDVALTSALLAYADDLAHGKVDPEEIGGEWHLEPRPVDLVAALESAVADGGVGAALDELAPTQPEYRRLRSMLSHYRELAVDGWPTVADGPTLELGETGDPERLEALVKRLHVEGDLSEKEAKKIHKQWQRDARRTAKEARRAARKAARAGDGATPAVDEPTVDKPTPEALSYPEVLAAAVERFQRRHGLLIDGKVGPETLGALNVPADERARQIELNLERWRWLASFDLPDRHIRVNVPEYRLRAFDGGRPVLQMKVVVGKKTWPTPIFADEMTYVEINPYWNVPYSIATQEILPAVKRNPGYLAKENMEVLANGSVVDPSSIDWSAMNASNFQYRIRQRPGPQNALGQIKFIFPNNFAVYLHDTPAQSAFDRHRRSLSHGCVRVERPLDLARYVVEEHSDWTLEDVRATLGERAPERVNLEKPLPVFILYWTAFQTADGVAHFRDDVYGYDEDLDEALIARHEQRVKRTRG